MDATTYMQETARTWQTDGLTWREQMSNAALGLVGELGEFVRRPSADELGDCYFYAATLARMLGERGEHVDIHTWSETRKRYETPDHVAATEAGEAALHRAARVAEWVKKLCYHDKPEAVADTAIALESATDQMLVAAYALATSPGKVMAANIAKLRERHPDGWHTEYQS